ncbi:hypothetical protein ACFVGV_06010 [Pseudarthrobacter scleromae]|uniref:hypothetical protein n=1 Tax=Pseudarthrobacter scleromae TaxID=158897 RepID=UPI00363F8579
MKTLIFRLDGVTYECGAEPPNFDGKVVRRFTYGQEPKVIAELGLVDGAALEIHGYAEHWTNDEVCVVWTDDNFQHCSCWVQAAKVRRPPEDDWHGNYVAR